MFEHNMPNQNLYVNITIYSVSGKTVKTIRTMVNTEGTRCDSIEWDGRDEYGDKLGKGVYLYKLAVKSQNGFSDSQYQKIILLN
jgi:flagellar hook assembly protein FlgD